MSCCEHECLDCGWFTMDNKGKLPKFCPICGGQVRHYWDEENDHDE